MKGRQLFVRLAAPLMVLLILSACAGKTRAPVEERAPAPTASKSAEVPAAPTVARPGYYIVKKGETLYGIALEHGQDWRDLVAWNGLDNPNRILVGQELRVAPPDNATVAKVPAPGANGIESRPIEPKGGTGAAPGTATPAAPAAPDNGLRREPRGGKLAYSDQALASAQKADAASRNGSKPPVASSSEPKAEQSSPKPVDNEATKSTEARGDEDLDWAWPAAGKVIAPFSDSGNKGVDIAGQSGDSVTAAGAGKVVYVGAGLRGYGNLVIIKHNSSFLSAYAHNQKILVKEGQAVKRGQEIALLGDSDADRPKLHFEIRRQGKPVDPLKYLPKR